jgi:hypothetical protein
MVSLYLSASAATYKKVITPDRYIDLGSESEAIKSESSKPDEILTFLHSPPNKSRYMIIIDPEDVLLAIRRQCGDVLTDIKGEFERSGLGDPNITSAIYKDKSLGVDLKLLFYFLHGAECGLMV